MLDRLNEQGIVTQNFSSGKILVITEDDSFLIRKPTYYEDNRGFLNVDRGNLRHEKGEPFLKQNNV